MGYRIDYRPIKKIRGAQRQKTGVPALTCVCLLLFLLLVNAFWPDGADFLEKLVFSQHQNVTVDAMDRLVSDLQEGASLSAALDAFCSSLLSHDQSS